MIFMLAPLPQIVLFAEQEHSLLPTGLPPLQRDFDR
jgi:hypothetical protein